MKHPRKPAPAAPEPIVVTRRTAVQATLGVAGAVVLGCSDDSALGGGGAGAGSQTGGEGTGGVPGTGGGGSPNGQGGQGGALGGGGQGGEGGAGGSGPTGPCADDGGLSPEELLAPVQTIVVLCMENRSFDHYLGSLRLVEGRMDIEGLDGTESNLDPDGNDVPVFNLLDFTPADPPHGWDASHAQFNGGANDGFVTEHAGADQNDVMGYHLREQIPITYALADGSAISDHWFASVMGPTWPNRFYLHGATSGGQKANFPVLGFQSVFGQLDTAGISNRNYYHDIAWASGAYFKTLGNATIETFFDDAAAGTLPQFSIIDPMFLAAGANDDHPDHDIQLGQALISSVYQALAQSPQWSSCMLVITYDEHGGFFDHVPPPTTVDGNAEFTQMGFRVPSLVCGPFARKGCAVKTQFEHVSVIKTLCTRFGIPALNARVTSANDLSSCIDPAFVGEPQPPIELPVLEISLSEVLARAPRNNHPELSAAADRGDIPAHLDRRAESDAITERVLREGVRLGAVRLI